MATSLNPAKTANSRVFIIEGRARPDHAPVYQSCMRMTGIDQGLGDIEKIECPDPYNYGSFIEIGSIRGAKDRVTTTLEGRYAMDARSTMLRLAREGCAVDLQLHLGECTDPSVFNKFKKAIILEDARPTNYGTDDLGALASGDNAAVNETLDISASDAYEVVPVTYTSQASSIVVNEVLDVVICDAIGCGECTSQSDGCQKIYALAKMAGGSPATLPDIIFSLNGGVTWYAHDIDALSTFEPDEIECLGDYVIVVSNAADGIAYVLKEDLNSYEDPAFTLVTTGIVAAGSPNAVWSTGSYAFIVGDAGYIYGTADATAGVTVLSAGTVVTTKLLCVHGLSENFAVAGGNDGTVVYTEDGVTWAEATRPVGVGININTVWVKSEEQWIVGTSNGRLYYTLNKGVTWTEKTFTGSGAGVVYSLFFPTASVGYMSHSTATPAGRILRTYDGGHSWKLTPEESGSLAANDRIDALASCWINPNFVVGVGLADDASDGIIVVGNAN